MKIGFTGEEARSLAEARMAEVAKEYPELKEWKVRLYKAKSYIGLCNYKRMDITISTVHCADMTQAELLNTINHELAHAIAGCSAGHGPKWKATAVRLGAKPVSRGHIANAKYTKRYLLVIGDKVYGERDNKVDTSSMYLRGKKRSTLGKLTIVENPAYNK